MYVQSRHDVAHPTGNRGQRVDKNSVSFNQSGRRRAEHSVRSQVAVLNVYKNRLVGQAMWQRYFDEPSSAKWTASPGISCPGQVEGGCGKNHRGLSRNRLEYLCFQWPYKLDGSTSSISSNHMQLQDRPTAWRWIQSAHGGNRDGGDLRNQGL